LRLVTSSPTANETARGVHAASSGECQHARFFMQKSVEIEEKRRLLLETTDVQEV
jgi:hypothetical protein